MFMKCKPKNHWTKEKCKKLLLKYTSIGEFRKSHSGAYNACWKNGWLPELSSHISQDRKKKWTKELCHKSALKYKTRWEFTLNDPDAYHAARYHNWLGEICSHMGEPYIKWTKELCHVEALKYETRIEFNKKNKKAYDVATYYGWLDEICSHMNPLLIFWTKEMCHEVALKYSDRVEFKNNETKAYNWACRNGCLNEVCSHMPRTGDRMHRLIYVYIFPDRSVYVGLTYNEKKRKNDHLFYRKNSTVNKHIEKTGLKPKYKNLTDYVPNDMAIILEGEYIERYKKGGYKILNKIKAGNLGGNYKKWTKELCHKEALKYSGRWEFRLGSTKAYAAARMHGWLNEVCSHMELKLRFWTKDLCLEEVAKYSSLREWRKNSQGSYRFAKKNNMIDECCEHMKTNKCLTHECTL